jgi:hypothetical protein
MKSPTCPNRHCPPSKNAGAGAIIRHGFYRTRSGSLIATSAGLVEGPFARPPGHPIIDSNIGAHSLMKSPPSVSKASISLPSLESSESPGIRFIAGWKERGSGAVSFQRSKSKGTLSGGASSRRDPNDHWGQGTGDLGFRRDRRLVPALAVEGRRQTKLPQHAGSVSRAFQPNES